MMAMFSYAIRIIRYLKLIMLLDETFLLINNLTYVYIDPVYSSIVLNCRNFFFC